MKLLEVYVSSGPQETHAYAACFAKALPPDSIVALKGDLGAGKTTWVRGMAEGLGLDPRIVSSPTFTLLNIYPSIPPLYHFDLYRLPSSEEFCKAGFDDYLRAGGISCVEWAEKIELPADTYQIVLSYTGQDTRLIQIYRAQEGFVNLGAGEEERCCQVAASSNLQNLTERGIERLSL